MTLVPPLKTSTLSKELQLQLKIIRTEDVQTLEAEDFSQINWDEFYDLLLHHRTFSYVYFKLKQTSFVPENILNRLHNMYKNFTFEMLHLTREMAHVQKTFQQSGIRTIFLKGPVLAKELYGDLSLRTSSDLDLLVPIDDLDTVDDLLKEDGYVKDDYIRSILGDWKWRHHHVAYYHPEKEIKLEVHWRLNPGPWKEPSFEELWNRKKVSYVTSEPLYRLGNEDLFLFLISHGARHGWSRLRWLLDLVFLLDKDMNMPRLKQLFKKYHSNQLAGQTLILVNQLFGTPVHKDLASFMKIKQAADIADLTLFYLQNKINLHSDPVSEHVTRFHEKYLFQMKSSQQKCIFVLSFLYPYPEDQDILRLPKSLHALYFPLRPILWIWKKMRMRVESVN